jgi:hypothetical protein
MSGACLVICSLALTSSTVVRSLHDVPLSYDLDPADVSAFWDQAGAYKDRGLQRGTMWKLLMDNPRWRPIIAANNYNAADIYNKIKKEQYARGACGLLSNDAARFVEAGKLMECKGDGFFRLVLT